MADFLRRVAKDPRAHDAAGRATPFLRVHVILVVIALVLAALSAVGGVLVGDFVKSLAEGTISVLKVVNSFWIYLPSRDFGEEES